MKTSHTRTFDAEAAKGMSGIASAGEMEIVYRPYVPSLYYLFL